MEQSTLGVCECLGNGTKYNLATLKALIYYTSLLLGNNE